MNTPLVVSCSACKLTLSPPQTNRSIRHPVRSDRTVYLRKRTTIKWAQCRALSSYVRSGGLNPSREETVMVPPMPVLSGRPCTAEVVVAAWLIGSRSLRLEVFDDNDLAA